ncbi:MAG TPA: anti-sigma factor [Methylomirabilota bacterium]|nr:anti-sigma factor [Methylomirabilota bacterium]
MTRDEISELAAAYALGSLEGGDLERFEALLRAEDADALAALRDAEGTLVDLAAAAPVPPPPAVKAALMDRVAAEAAARRVLPPPLSRPRRPRRWWPVVLSGAMAAGLAAVIVGWSVSATYEQRLDALARDADQLRAELRRQQAVVTILRDPATQVVTLAGLPPAPAARARMLWHAGAGGVFVAAGLPAPPPDKTYQLWAIAGSAPVSAGVFSVDASGAGSLSVAPLPGVSAVDAFAVTLEPAGGRPAPTGEMYLLGKS